MDATLPTNTLSVELVTLFFSLYYYITELEDRLHDLKRAINQLERDMKM